MAAGKKRRQVPEEAVCRKNDVVVLQITDMGAEGEGIGRLDGYTLFVKDALPGDTVRAGVMKTKKRYGYARLLEILEPSPYRTEPQCPVARQCGGCQLQHCSYEKQVRWKEEKVCECLNRIGGFHVAESYATDVEHTGDFQTLRMEPILAMDAPYHYRNKAQFPVRKNRDGKPAAGFYAGRTHRIVENTDCAIQHPCNHAIVETVLRFMEEYGVEAYDETVHTGLVRHILTRVGVHTGEVMVCLVINGTALPHSETLVERLRHTALAGRDGEAAPRLASVCLNINRERTNVILGREISVLYGRGYIEDRIGEIVYQISPLSFYQVNPAQTKRLYDTVLEYADLKGSETVWDLYCGIGTISLFLARRAAKVCGVEIVPQAVEDARRNMERNQLENVAFFAGAAEDVVPREYERSRGRLQADVVVLDPPRKGCEERLLQTVVGMQPSRIVYVSCDPATLARDLKYLCARGYELKRVRACDMFGMSYHVETVCVLGNKNRKPDDYLGVEIDVDKIHEILDKEKVEREAKEKSQSK